MTVAIVLERIMASKKFIYVAIPIVANAIAEFSGYNVTAKGMLVMDAGFALLLVFQGLLDIRFGSPSDDTVKK